MKTIDINADLGESRSTHLSATEKELMKYISSVNIACGVHAGSPLMMVETVKYAIKNHIAIGAHPGYPDLEGFGRVSMDISDDELAAIVVYQIGALRSIVEAHGGRLRHVKPHGAMYNDIANNYDKAMVVAEAIKRVDKNLIFIGLANSQMVAASKASGLQTLEEVFADRAYLESGLLVPRTEPGAVLSSATKGIEQVMHMVLDNYLLASSGKKISISANTVCVHGDNEKAIEFAKLLHQALLNSGIKIEAAHG